MLASVGKEGMHPKGRITRSGSESDGMHPQGRIIWSGAEASGKRGCIRKDALYGVGRERGDASERMHHEERVRERSK
jgi:hypothetical protein